MLAEQGHVSHDGKRDVLDILLESFAHAARGINNEGKTGDKDESTRTYFSRAARCSRTSSLMSAMRSVAYWPTRYSPPATPAERTNLARRSYRKFDTELSIVIRRKGRSGGRVVVVP